MSRFGFDEGQQVLSLCSHLMSGYQWPPCWHAGCKPSVTLKVYVTSVDREEVEKRLIDHRPQAFSVHCLDQWSLTVATLTHGQLFV